MHVSTPPGAWVAPGRVYNIEACAAHAHVYTTET
jgi:hypothetical protein